MSDSLEKEKISLTPDQGFNLVAIDPFQSTENQLYLIGHFDMYQDALKAKKERVQNDEYFILYKGPGGQYFCR